MSFLANNPWLLREKSDSWSLIRVLFSSKIMVCRPVRGKIYNWIETVFYSAKLINLLAWLRWTDGKGKVPNQVWVFCVMINIIRNVKKLKFSTQTEENAKICILRLQKLQNLACSGKANNPITGFASFKASNFVSNFVHAQDPT